MNIINRKSKEIVIERRIAYKPMHINVGRRACMFTSLACDICGVKEGKFVQFINEGNEWSFFVNNDEDGFKPLLVQKKGNAHRINSSGLCVMILKSYGFKNSKKFAIEKTTAVKDGSPIYKLTLNVM